MAVALTALLAAKDTTVWQRVEGMTPGETIRVVRDSGAPVERRFAGFDGDWLWVLAPGFRQLPRSTNRASKSSTGAKAAAAEGGAVSVEPAASASASAWASA